MSIVLASIVAHLVGLGNAGDVIAISKEMFGGVLQLDIGVIFNVKMLNIILVLFIIDFFGSVAKFIGLTRNTTIVNKDGTLPKMKETLSVDGLATIAGSALGTTSLTTYVESGVGIAEGGRTGFTAVVCSLLMLGFLALTPLVNLVPVIATTGALFWVGIHLFPNKAELKNYTKLDLVTVLSMIVATVWTFSIDKALLVGFVIYIGGQIVTGKFKEINMYMVISTILLLVGTLLSL